LSFVYAAERERGRKRGREIEEEWKERIHNCRAQ